jgi:hypothetical protein
LNYNHGEDFVAIYYIDGEFVPAEKAVIPVDDLAILRGIGVFDLLRTYDGKPYFLDAHIDRLEGIGHKKSDSACPGPMMKSPGSSKQTLAKNDIPEANIRIVVTGGSSIGFHDPVGQPPPAGTGVTDPPATRSLVHQGGEDHLMGGGAPDSRCQEHRLHLGQPGPEKSGRRRRHRSHCTSTATAWPWSAPHPTSLPLSATRW